MERNWIYKDDLGSEYGPYSRAELERYAREGRVSHKGSIQDPEGNWSSPEDAGLELPPEQVDIESRSHPAIDPNEAHREARVQFNKSPHQRSVYMLLGILLPLFVWVAGVNNLIVGRTANGIVQLVLSVLSIICALAAAVLVFPICIALPLWFGIATWSIIEAATNTIDGEGRMMQ